MKALLKLLWADVRHHGRRLLLVASGLTLATTLFVLLCALGLGVRLGLLQQWGENLPGHMVEVKPQGVQVGPLELNLGQLVGDGPLTLDQVEDLSHLPHVRAAYPVLDVPLPMAAHGGASLFGKTLATQIFISGLPEALLAQTPLGAPFVDDPAGAIPVVIHESLVTLYNTTVASALKTPKIASNALVGLSFDLVLGHSPLMATGDDAPVRHFRAKIVGTSPYALPLGVSVPFVSGKRLLDSYGPSTRGTTPLRSVLLEADGPEALLGIGREVATLGLHVDERATQIGHMLGAMVVVLALVGLLALALSGVGMVYAFAAYVEGRNRELTLMRVVGATPMFVLALMLLEALVLGVAAGASGVALAAGIIKLGPLAWGEALQQVPLLPAQLFVLPPALALGAVGLTVCTALLGALGPSIASSRARLVGTTHAL